jgi:AcrR family transcriptional regulator
MSVKPAGGAACAHDPAPLTRRSRNPHGQGGRLRAELIAAADRILAQTGDVEALSLRGVAREVGIATPSIYLHFPDKAALVQAVLEARFEQLRLAVRAAAETHAADGPAAQLRAGCLAYCRFATEHPNAYRVLFGRRPGRDLTLPAKTLTPPGGEVSPGAASSLPVGAEAFGFLVDGVSRCMAADLAPQVDPMRIATSVWTALHGIVALRGSVPHFPWPPLEQQVDDVLRGIVGLRE